MDALTPYLMLLCFASGIAIGAGLTALNLVHRWDDQRRDLLNRVHAPSPGDYIALRQATETLDAAKEPAKAKSGRKDPGPKPWAHEAQYIDTTIDVDAAEGIVYFQEGEDTWEEDAGAFLGQYGLTPAQYAAKWEGT